MLTIEMVLAIIKYGVILLVTCILYTLFVIWSFNSSESSEEDNEDQEMV